jgi:hypothetical protein
MAANERRDLVVDIEGIVSGAGTARRSFSSAPFHRGLSADSNRHDPRTQQMPDKIAGNVKQRRRFAE